MRYKIIFAFLFLIPFGLQAQKKHSINIEALANYSVYNTDGNPPKMVVWPGMDAGIKYYYRPEKLYSLYLGAAFTQYNYLTTKTKATFIDTNGIPKEQGYPLTDFRIKLSISTLSMPIGVRFHAGKRFTIGLGATIMRLLSANSKSILYYGGNALRRTSDANSDKEFYKLWMLNGHTEIGYTMPLFKSNITWKAAFDYGITNYFVKGFSGKLHPYTFGLGVSVPLWKY